MRQIIVITVVNFILCLYLSSEAQVLWKEHFQTPNKGFWSDDSDKLKLDTTDILWGLDVSYCSFKASGDYAMTVASSEGRFEVLDSDGDAIWYSPIFDISAYDAVNISFTAGESGSNSSAAKKYIKPMFLTEEGRLCAFPGDSIVSGNWGNKLFSVKGIKGNTLQLFIIMNSSLSADKVFIDDVSFSYVDSSKIKPDKINAFDVPSISFKGEKFNITAKCMNGYNELVNDSNIQFTLSSNDLKIINHYYHNGLYSWIVMPDKTGEIRFCILNDSLKINSSVHSVNVFDYKDVILKEDFENYRTDDTVSTQWSVSQQNPVSGEKSLNHLIQNDSGEGIYYMKLNDSIDLTTAEYFFSFKIRNGDWDPTSSNCFFISLLETPTDSSSVDEYVAGVNAKGSTDKVSFWKYKNGKITDLIAETNYEWNENSSAEILIKRLSSGIWQISVIDLNSGEVFSSSGFDDEIININSFKLTFKYSQSRSGKLTIDDIIFIRKNLPPQIEKVEISKGGLLKVYFNEPIDARNISISNFYLFSNYGSQIDLKDLLVENESLISFKTEFSGIDSLTFKAFNISDDEGKTSDTLFFRFFFQFPFELHEIVFTEIMCDPDPVVGLPDAEYLEIYNLSEKRADLRGWKLEVKGKNYLFEHGNLQAFEYAIICHPADSILFDGMGKIISVDRFPALTNSGSAIRLLSSDDVLIDEVTYSDTWYSDTDKKGGGYSLEKEDPARNCGNTHNWKASENEMGGTPGILNSVNKSNSDTIPPFISDFKVVSPVELDLCFSEPLDTSFQLDIQNFNINDLLVDSILNDNEKGVVKLFLKAPVLNNVTYSVFIDNVFDECGNAIRNVIYEFSKEKISFGDILINEVLFNTYSGGSDFIELYNNSLKDIDLSVLSFVTRDDSMKMKSIYKISDSKVVIKKGDYVAITESIDGIIPFYSILFPENIIEVKYLPAMNDDSGIIVLVDDSLNVIDEFEYDETMHDLWISDKNGVSLERTSFTMATNDPFNWHSAASVSGFATPGYSNSERENHETTGFSVSLNPVAISPNGDGYNDEMIISLEPDKPGYLINVFVFDISGREVRRISNNETLGSSGYLTFNGFNNCGKAISPGIYIMYFEMLHREGKRRVIKKTCLVLE